MNGAAIMAEALGAMRANRLRSFLTMLGMIIGVAAVILLLAIGQGAQYQVTRAISQMGSNLIIVLSGSSTSGGVHMGFGTVPTLTLGDAEAIGQLSSIAAESPVVPGVAQLVHGGSNWSTQVSGVTPPYLAIRDWSLASGYAFTEADVRASSRVVILGQTVANNLFGDESPVGKTIRIQKMPFLVVGLLASKGQSLMGQDQDDTALVPVTTAQTQLFGTQFPGTVRYIMVQAASAGLMNRAQTDITGLLRQRHHLTGPAKTTAPDDFQVRNLTALVETAASMARTLSVLLGSIASISLLVGGIGIMNIMLVSVTERTREIGIRKAVGARRRDITVQFLSESVIISVAGCLIGVAVGIAGAYGAYVAIHMPVVVTASAIGLSFVVALAVGVFFGLYPARKAATLNPIEALRYP